MDFIYNAVNIINDVHLTKAIINDTAGGRADSIELEFSDVKNQWRNWSVKKGDTVQLIKGEFKSGIMFVDSFGLSNGKFKIYAKSTPLKAKELICRTWENISFIQMGSELALVLGLKLKTYGIQEFRYKRLDLLNRTPLGYLNERCILEGYALKVTDNKLVIFNERDMEQSQTIKEFDSTEFEGGYEFNTKGNSLYSSCIVKCYSEENQLIEYEFKSNVIGPKLIKDIKVDSLGEAERYSKNLLRYENKFETIGSFTIRLDDKLASGNVINIKLNDFSGKYFIYGIRHDLINNKSSLKVRRVLEGY